MFLDIKFESSIVQNFVVSKTITTNFEGGVEGRIE